MTLRYEQRWDKRWPMCGRPTEYACDRCRDVGKPCYCDRHEYGTPCVCEDE